MQRLATTVAIAAWIGFLAVFSAELALDALAPGLLVKASSLAVPPALSAQFGGIGPVLAQLAPPAELMIAAVCLFVSALLARSLFVLHAGRRADVAQGELLALAALGCLAVLTGAAQLTGVPLLPIDLGGGLVWLAIALSVAAIAFDRLVAIDTAEDLEEDGEFQARFSDLAQRMGRQTALYTLPDPRPAGGTKDQRP